MAERASPACSGTLESPYRYEGRTPCLCIPVKGSSRSLELSEKCAFILTNIARAECSRRHGGIFHKTFPIIRRKKAMDIVVLARNPLSATSQLTTAVPPSPQSVKNSAFVPYKLPKPAARDLLLRTSLLR